KSAARGALLVAGALRPHHDAGTRFVGSRWSEGQGQLEDVPFGRTQGLVGDGPGRGAARRLEGAARGRRWGRRLGRRRGARLGGGWGSRRLRERRDHLEGGVRLVLFAGTEGQGAGAEGQRAGAE